MIRLFIMSNVKEKKLIDITQRNSLLLTIVELCNDSKKFEHHLEDIAIKNKEKYPLFFGWSKYKDQIDLRQVSRTLIDLKTDGLLSGSNTTNWALTKKGYYHAEKILENDFKTSRVKIRKNADFHSFELRRILQSECYMVWNSSENYADHISTYDLKYLFRIDNYNERHFIRNSERLYLAAHKDKELTQFIDAMMDLLKERKIINEEKK